MKFKIPAKKVIVILLHFSNEKYFGVPFLVLQLVTNRLLVSVPGRTNHYHVRNIGVQVGESRARWTCGYVGPPLIFLLCH